MKCLFRGLCQWDSVFRGDVGVESLLELSLLTCLRFFFFDVLAEGKSGEAGQRTRENECAGGRE